MGMCWWATALGPGQHVRDAALVCNDTDHRRLSIRARDKEGCMHNFSNAQSYGEGACRALHSNLDKCKPRICINLDRRNT